MFSQLAELKTIGGVERLNCSIEFLQANTARVVITSQVSKSATGELAELLKRPIVVTGALNDLDMMLTNEIFNFSTAFNEQPPQPSASNGVEQECTANQEQNSPIELTSSENDFEEESL